MEETAEQHTLYGTAGWTEASGVKRLLHADMCIAFNPSFCRFSRADKQAVKELRKIIPPENLKDHQNRAPTLEEFINAALTSSQEVFLSGYIVGPPRHDERVSVDGVVIRNSTVAPPHRKSMSEPVGEARDKCWRALSHSLGIAPHRHNLPDEMIPTYQEDSQGLWTWWLWWD